MKEIFVYLKSYILKLLCLALLKMTPFLWRRLLSEEKYQPTCCVIAELLQGLKMSRNVDKSSTTSQGQNFDIEMKKHKAITDLQGNKVVSDAWEAPNCSWTIEPQALSLKNGCMCMCARVPSLFTGNCHNLLNQLYPNTK